MTKRNHDLLRDLLDELCVRPIYTAACARCGISAKSLWRFIRASQHEDDPNRALPVALIMVFAKSPHLLLAF